MISSSNARSRSPYAFLPKILQAIHFTLVKSRSYSSTILLSVSLAAGLVMSPSVQAKTVIKLGWATADGKIDPYAIMAHDFADALNKSAPGKYDVQLFPNHQLGVEGEMLQGMQLGSVDMAVITQTYIGNIVPSFQLGDLPFLYTSSDQAFHVLDGKVGKLLFKKLAKKGIIGLGYANAGFRNVINNVRPINKPGDLNSIRLRVQPSNIFIAGFKALGANPIPMSWSDVFTSVQQHTIDGLEIPLAVIYANKFPEVTKYLSLTQHTFNAPALLISSQTWKKLGKDQQAVFREAAKTAIALQRKTVSENEEALLKKIKAAGMVINTVSDKSAFKEKVKPVYEHYRDSIGSDILDAAIAETK